jgi:hypothetical protein
MRHCRSLQPPLTLFGSCCCCATSARRKLPQQRSRPGRHQVGHHCYHCHHFHQHPPFQTPVPQHALTDTPRPTHHQGFFKPAPLLRRCAWRGRQHKGQPTSSGTATAQRHHQQLQPQQAQHTRGAQHAWPRQRQGCGPKRRRTSTHGHAVGLVHRTGLPGRLLWRRLGVCQQAPAAQF